MDANVIHFSFKEASDVKHCRPSNTNKVENGRVYPNGIRQNVASFTTIPSPICRPADSVIGDQCANHSQRRATTNRITIPRIDIISRNWTKGRIYAGAANAAGLKNARNIPVAGWLMSQKGITEEDPGMAVWI